MKTTQITVRNVDADLKQRIDKLAKLKSMSINDLALAALRDKVGIGEKPAEKNYNWEQYSGLMDDGAFNQDVFNDFEAIDEAMWTNKY